MSHDEVAHKILNDKLDATAAVPVTVMASENSQLHRALKAQVFFLQNCLSILIGNIYVKISHVRIEMLV